MARSAQLSNRYLRNFTGLLAAASAGVAWLAISLTALRRRALPRLGGQSPGG
ncbi:MAG: hypothetical protein M3071_14650 [Actinomycetota bacterium]|nr:hypothetical protein [Actinomycetota bacterium]